MLDTAPDTSEHMSHSYNSNQQHAAADALQPVETAAEQEQHGVTNPTTEQEAVQKLQQALAKTQEVGKIAVDQLRSSAADLHDKGKAALEHVQASTPDLTPVNKNLQGFSQVAVQQLQAAAAKAQQVGQGSLEQVCISASDLAKQVPWDRVQLQPPSWLPGIPQPSNLLSTQQQHITARSAQHAAEVAARPFQQQHYSDAYRPANGVYASDASHPTASAMEQVQQANAGSVPEHVLPAYRWHSKHQSHHLATLPKPVTTSSLISYNPFSASEPAAKCTFAQSSILLPGVNQSFTDQSIQTDGQALASDQLYSPGCSDAAAMRDPSETAAAAQQTPAGRANIFDHQDVCMLMLRCMQICALYPCKTLADCQDVSTRCCCVKLTMPHMVQ